MGHRRSSHRRNSSNRGNPDIRAWVYRAASTLLISLGTLTALTGARTPVIWFKVCPVLLAVAALVLFLASL